MIKIIDHQLAQTSIDLLQSLQSLVNLKSGYAEQVIEAKFLWDSKTSTSAKSAAFGAIRSTLASMCTGSVRCGYCEDSAADEIEHIRPKSIFPENTFQWTNYLYTCGSCNVSKSNRVAIITDGILREFSRARTGPSVRPPLGEFAMINPRNENPFDLLELDMVSVNADKMLCEGTFYLVPASGLSILDEARAKFTIEVLDLNREVISVARRNAFSGFRARLHEYVEHRGKDEEAFDLNRFKEDLLKTPHLTVFLEMRRQREFLPNINSYFKRAPETIELLLN